MSCRHDLALGTCAECYPSTGTIRPTWAGDSLDGPGAVPRRSAPTLRDLARRASDAITALDACGSDLRRAAPEGGAAFAVALRNFADAQNAALTSLSAMVERLYDRGRVMLGDECNRYRSAVVVGIVNGAWALRVVSMAEEVGDGQA